MSQISQLVSEYNRIEGEQTERLRQICELLAEVKGPARPRSKPADVISFGIGPWGQKTLFCKNE